MDQSLNKKHHVKDTTIKWDFEESNWRFINFSDLYRGSLKIKVWYDISTIRQ